MLVIILPDIPAEDQLLVRARQNDESAMLQIYDYYFPPIFQFIRLRVDDQQQAEDLASDVFLKLVQAMHGRNAPTHSLRGWLFRVARNVLHDYYGKEKKFTTTTLEEWLPAPTSGDPEIQFMRSLSVERMRHALKMLATDQQEVLILRFGQTLSLQETADIMGKSLSAVKSLQFRAVNTLRGILGDMHMENANG